MSQPNILLITTDQQRWDALSLWGTPGLHTPNLDRLAREGVCFERAYSSSPVCTPARVSMITGQYSTRHGAWTIGMSPVSALCGPTLGTLFADAGYRTALIGKTHFVSRRIEDQHVAGVDLNAACPGSDFWRNFDGPYCGFEFLRHHRHHNAAGQPNAHYRAWLEDRGVDLPAIDALHGNGVNRPTVGCWNIDPELTQNAWITDETARWISESHDGRPWLAMANYQDPHYPLICPEPYYSQVDMSQVDLGGVADSELNSKPPFYRRFLEGHYWSDDDQTKFWDGINIPDTKLASKQPDPEAAVRAYLGMCAMVDDYVGRLLDSLRRAGQLENTLVMFTSDHGELMGRHGMWGKGTPSYDDNQRIPMLMWWGGDRGAGLGRGLVPAHASLVDLLPTACDAAAISLPPGVQGISQLPVVRGEVESVRDWALIDHVASRNILHPELDTVDLHQTTLVHNGWKIVVYAHTERYGELYHLEVDPDQLENRWHQDLEQRHTMLLRLARAEMERSGTLPTRIAPA